MNEGVGSEVSKVSCGQLFKYMLLCLDSIGGNFEAFRSKTFQSNKLFIFKYNLSGSKLHLKAFLSSSTGDIEFVCCTNYSKDSNATLYNSITI